MLTVSSYPARTSPVLRGKWILQNLLDSPPPPPPPNVPSLDEKAIGATVSMRQQLEQHRANPACRGCHARMDPLGFDLENYDAIGQWRTQDGSLPVDLRRWLPDALKQAFCSAIKTDSPVASLPNCATYALGRKAILALGHAVTRRSLSSSKKISDLAPTHEINHSSRRSILRGLGAAVSLPLLDAMVPAFASTTSTAAPLRLAFIYVPNGILMDQWTPTADGPDFELTRILAPLAPHRENVLVLSGLAQNTGTCSGRRRGRSRPRFGHLSHRRASQEDRWRRHLRWNFGGPGCRQPTSAMLSRFPSLELACEDGRMVGSCDSGYSCAYSNTLSWRTPATPLAPRSESARACSNGCLATSTKIRPNAASAWSMRQAFSIMFWTTRAA